MRMIISLGGSIIVPDKININFLKRFRKIIINLVKKNHKFAIYCGGGRIARDYQKALSKLYKATSEDLDWLGIYATIINANFLRLIFKDFSEENIIVNPTEKIRFKKNILVCAGWKPGWSTDYDAVLLAKNLGIRTVVNITDVDYVYDKNPKKHKNAKPIKKLTWKEFRKLVGSKWDPGLSMPFDPIAAKKAEKLKLKVIIVGKDLRNLESLLNKKEFKGTVIL